MKRKTQLRDFRLILCLMLLVAQNTWAQQLTVNGTVQDAEGEPIIGANVVEVGTTNGVITDLEGHFSLSVASGASLQVTYVGMQTLTLKAQPRMTITLQDDSELLDEIVVVGYGATKRKNFTGSVATFNVGEGGLSLTVPSSATDMLRGIAPGLTVSQSGIAGEESSMQVRGQKSINGGSDPLVVVDGVIFKGSINDLNPDIIASMSVLKDATSLAAYGSQAANGVIMVTTKKGEKGKPVINVRATLSLNESNYKPEVWDGYGYIKLINARNDRDEDDTSWMGDLELANYEKGEWTDWYDFVSRTGVRQNYSVSISGGNDQMDYLIGGSFMDNKNFIKGNTFIRNTANARINTKINKYIRVGMNFNYANMKMDGLRPDYTYFFSPWAEPYLDDGVTIRKFILGSKETTTQNPLWDVQKENVDAQNRAGSLTVGGEVEIKIPYIDGLSYKATLSYTKRTVNDNVFYHERYFLLDTEDYTSSDYDNHLAEAYGYRNVSTQTSYVMDHILTYTKEWGDHFISATAVYTRDSDKQYEYEIYGSNFESIGNTTQGFYGLNNASAQKMSESTYSLHRNVGYLARVSYSFRDTYHFNASVRRDGSSVFGADKKWGTFPAFGVAWTISNEKFWKNIDWASNTKLKASWGKNGNQSLDPYGTLSSVAVGQSGGYTYYFGDTAYYGQSLSTLGNPDLGWETTTSWNFGLETDLLKGRLHFEVDAYSAQTKDQIFSRTILSLGTGITSQLSTMGQVNNWGIEATLSSVNIKRKDFLWTSTLSFTLNRNKLKELYGDGNDDITNSLFLGKSLGAIYGYKWIGNIQDNDEGNAYIAVNGGNYGDPMYANLDGSADGAITTDDRTILGYDKESWRACLTNTLTYKNWSLYFVINGIFSGGGYGKAENTVAFTCYETMAWNNAEKHPWWTEENKSDKYLAPTADTSKFTGLQSYGFVRLQDLNLAYNFKGDWLKKAGIQQLQVYLSGTNLLCFAPGWDFSDPEVRSSRSQQLTRSYTFGMNIRF